MINTDKYEGLIDAEGYIDYDGLDHLLAEIKRLRRQRRELCSILSNYDGVWIDEDDLNERVKELIE